MQYITKIINELKLNLIITININNIKLAIKFIIDKFVFETWFKKINRLIIFHFLLF